VSRRSSNCRACAEMPCVERDVDVGVGRGRRVAKLFELSDAEQAMRLCAIDV
jgi:hypothetical protein